MPFVEPPEHSPPCSRCGRAPLTSAVMPQRDAAGRPIRLELCPACGDDRPAATALLDWFAANGGLDPSRAAEGARLLMAWTQEGMAAYGWGWVRIQADASADADGPADGPGRREVPRPAAGRSAGRGRAQVTRLQRERDALRSRLAAAAPEEREALKASVRALGEALARALITHDAGAQALRAEAPRVIPGPLSPETERRIHDLYRLLIAEQNERDADSMDADSGEG